jgi:nucleotide-binding universal stress UspA family protein
MKYLVAYKGTSEARAALVLAIQYAKALGAFVYVITSEEGGAGEKSEDVARVHQDLKEAGEAMEKAGIKGEVLELVRGLSAGEDIVEFAGEKQVDHIFVGIEKKSKARKILLGSTAQYIILKAHCPVTTMK